MGRREGDHILICTGEGSVKAKNTRRDPRVALSIVDLYAPQEAQLRDHLIERVPIATSRTWIDPISHKYSGKPFPFRSPKGRVALVVEIEKA